MKQIALNISILFIVLLAANSTNSISPEKIICSEQNNFQLHFMNIGYGVDRFRQQPVFRINDEKYIYTYEDVWIFKKWKPAKPDTISTGDFRHSSIDSILYLVRGIKDSVIFKMSSYMLGAGSQSIDISYGKRKIRFQLDGAFDSTAQKIVDILNCYIPKEAKKLWLSRFREN